MNPSEIRSVRVRSVRDTVAVLAVCAGTLTLSSCAQHNAADAASTTEATKTATVVAVTNHRGACELVTAREMSAILGATLTAQKGSNERPPSQTECDYSSATAQSAYTELEVDWNGGELQAFKKAAGLTGGAAPGSANALKGLGEAAYQVAGTQVFISTGGNLMMIRFLPGAHDVISRARRIYKVAKARL